MIKHEPHFDTEKIIEHYTKKDGVPVTYVCTSALGNEAQAMDIFFRETPHPEFGNRYFAEKAAKAARYFAQRADKAAKEAAGYAAAGYAAAKEVENDCC